jgi:excinuclease ABC subunit C
MFDIKTFLTTLPHQPGIYQMMGEGGKILYIGKARHLKKRVASYFNKSLKDTKTAALLKHIVDIRVIVTQSENEALLLESNLIKLHKPHYNVLFRDDKSYPYILISTNHRYPRIDFYRGSKKPGGKYFGPYPNSTAVRETINLIQKLFRIRTCTDSFFSNRTRPCLLHQIGRCTGPCVALIPEEEYCRSIHYATLFLEGKNDQIINELAAQMERTSVALQFEAAAKFRDQIGRLRAMQEKQYVTTKTQENIDVIGLAKQAGAVCIQLTLIRHGRMLGSQSYFPETQIGSSDEEIMSAFISQHYLMASPEDVPKEILLSIKISEKTWLVNALSEQVARIIKISVGGRGERKKWLASAIANAKQVLIHHLLNKANLRERFETLQTVLDLQKLPERIECFDISHTMGEETVGACVVFNSNGPVKNDYRRFNIKAITPGDDVAAMAQVLSRRYYRLQKEEAKFPDIILIDGGHAQLNTAAKVLTDLNIQGITLIGVAKGVSRKAGLETLYLIDQPPVHLSPDSLALHLIQQVRDEAHRFAITGHRMRRDKKRTASKLETIPGIGAKRRRELLRYFGGIQGLNHASLDEIAKVPGISGALAERIFAALHQ